MKQKSILLALCLLSVSCQSLPGAVNLFIPERFFPTPPSIKGQKTTQPLAELKSDAQTNTNQPIDLINTGGNPVQTPSQSTNSKTFNADPLLQRQNNGGSSGDPDPINPLPPVDEDPIFNEPSPQEDPLFPTPQPTATVPITVSGQCGSGTFVNNSGGTSVIPDPENNCGQNVVTPSKNLGVTGDHVVSGVQITNVPNQPPPDPAPVASFNLGNKIAYTSLINNKEELFITDIDGSNPSNITQSSDHEHRPIFSTDARYLAYATDRMKRGFEIFKISTDGQFLVRLTFDHLSATPYSWSSQNELIFMNQGDLYIYSHIDGSIRQLLKGTTLSSPSWSPDGNKIAFVLNGNIATVDRLGNNFQILISNGDITGKIDWSTNHFVYETNGNIRTIPVIGGVSNLLSNQQDSEPDWSPDGNKIVFTSRRTGQREVFTMNLDGSNVTQLTHHGAESYHPNW